jgi:hypothetical protein
VLCLSVCATAAHLSHHPFSCSLRKIIKKQIPTKKQESIDALLEAAATDQPEGRGKEFVYSSFFAENRNGDQGEVRAVCLFAWLLGHRGHVTRCRSLLKRSATNSLKNALTS